MPLVIPSKRIKELRSWVHRNSGDLPIVQVGKQGITATLIESVFRCVSKNEFVKIRMGSNTPVEIMELVQYVERGCDCVCVQSIGRTATFYREKGLPHVIPYLVEELVEGYRGGGRPILAPGEVDEEEEEEEEEEVKEVAVKKPVPAPPPPSPAAAASSAAAAKVSVVPLRRGSDGLEDGAVVRIRLEKPVDAKPAVSKQTTVAAKPVATKPAAKPSLSAIREEEEDDDEEDEEGIEDAFDDDEDEEDDEEEEVEEIDEEDPFGPGEDDDTYIQLSDLQYFKLDEDDPRLVELRELEASGKLKRARKTRPPVFEIISPPPHPPKPL